MREERKKEARKGERRMEGTGKRREVGNNA